MTWDEKKKYQETISVLDEIRPDYRRVSIAPDIYALMRRANEAHRPFTEIIDQECRVLYKSVETLTGNVMLCQNPALITYQAMRFQERGAERGTIVRMKPRLLMTYGQVKDFLKKRGKEKPDNGDKIDWNQMNL